MGQAGQHPPRRQAEPGGQTGQRRRTAIGLEADIAGEELIGPVAAQRHGHMAPGRAAQHPGRQQRGIRQRLVHPRRHRLEGVEQRRLVQRHHLMGEAEAPRQGLGRRRLVIAGARHGDGEGGQPRRMAGDEGGDQGGIDAAGKEHPHRHIGDQPVAHPGIEEGFEPLQPLALALAGPGRALLIGVGAPVAADLRAPLGMGQDMAGGELLQAAAQAVLARQIFEGEEARHGAGIDRQIAAGGMGQHGAGLGAEDEGPIGLRVIERLLPEAVAGEMEAAGLRLVEGEGEHAVDLLQGRGHAVTLEQAEQHLGIATVDEIDPGRHQLGGQSGEAVDLAVVDQRIAGERIDARLMAAVEIDDGETQMAEGDGAADMDSRRIRTAMRDGRQHASQQRLILGPRPVGVAQEAG